MKNGITSESTSLRKNLTSKSLIGAAFAAAAMLLPAAAQASSDFLPNPDSLSLSPQYQESDSSAQAKPDTDETIKPRFLDAAPAEQPNIHGFADVTFTTAYLTPRGLLVFKDGVVIQPIVGLVLPIGDLGPFKNYTWVSGVWNCITASQGDPDVGGWNEMDFFFSQSATVLDVINLNLTYGEWNFPQSTVSGKPKAEQNLDLKVGYDDSKMWGDSGFSLNPYADFWWAVAGSSTVTFGKGGDTGYIEIGIVPTYTIKGIPDYPLKLTVPTYFSVGPKDYWGRGGYIAGLSANSGGNFGVAAIAVNLDIPLSFIPVKYGHWHADVGISYDYLINGALLDAGTLLTGNTKRSLVEGSAGFGVNF